MRGENGLWQLRKSLTTSAPRTIQAVSPQEKEAIKSKARSEGTKYTELPSRGVFSIKPDKHRSELSLAAI